MAEHPTHWLKAWGLPDPPGREEVVRAYRRRAQRLHPDRAGQTPAAHAAFVELQAQYGVLLQYSARPWAFERVATAPPPPPRPSSARPSPAPRRLPEAPRAGWRIPPADITLRRSWTLAQGWNGGQVRLTFSRGRPCGCGVGCVRCQGTAVVFERVSVDVTVPPLPSLHHRVRLLGLGHVGDDHTAGDVWLELAWRAHRGWRWQDNRLVLSASGLSGAAWIYVMPPAGPVARLPRGHGGTWRSSAGLVAELHQASSRLLSWPGLVQVVRAFRWGWSQPGAWWRRPRSAQRAVADLLGSARVHLSP
jgi:hypothetical protein